MSETSAPERPPRTLVVACGALAREIMSLVRRHDWSDAIEVQCLPAVWHNFPERIAGGVRAKIRAAQARGRNGGNRRIFVAYGDCGTGGALDAVLEEEGAERIPGPHCYEFFSGAATFAALHDAEPGTLYLTDYLARNFDRLIIEGLGLDRHPELAPTYFGNYRRLVHLAQARDEAAEGMARCAAERLGLEFEHRFTGYGALEPFLARAALETGAGERSAAGRHTTRTLAVKESGQAPAGEEPARPAAPLRRTCESDDVHARRRAAGKTGSGRGRGAGPLHTSLAVVYWREIPAQVIARAGRRTARRALSGRFQEAIDRAAMRAGLSDSDAYLGEWRRGEAPAAGAGEDRRTAGGRGLEEQADALARRLEAEFTADRLAAFVAAGGRTPAGASDADASAAPVRAASAEAPGPDRDPEHPVNDTKDTS